jgi:MerR family Zn(II)-responsive transcriptional regulator of zntA
MMQIGDLAARTGVTARTIRFYEELGIISPDERTEGGFRLYSDNQLARLKIVLGLKALGFDLERIRSLFRLSEDSATAGELAQALTGHLLEQQREIDERIAQYQEMRARNEQALEVLRGCLRCTVRASDPDHDECLLYRQHPQVPEQIGCEMYQPGGAAEIPASPLGAG